MSDLRTKGRRLLTGSVVLFALSISYALSVPSNALEDEIYPPKGTSNGKRIYLSAAWHTDDAGARGECQGKVERTMARQLAYRTADYTYVDPTMPGNVNVALSGLTERGFRVRVGRGTPDENASRSNSWGSNAHVPLHSNASGDTTGTCANRTASIRGSWQIYNAGDGTGLPGKMKDQLDGPSPGTNDRVCTITVCTEFSCLVELCGISAGSASYSETEFHDWNAGVNWLTDDRPQVSVRIATAIDNHYGG